MDDVFNNAFSEEKQPEQAQQPAEAPQKAETVEQAERAAPEAGAESGTTPQEQAKHVPLAALEAERKGRQDWKEKAIRYEEELKALRERNQQPNQMPQQDQQPVDPIFNARLDFSEALVRSKHDDAEEVVNYFIDKARANPALVAQCFQSRFPWEFAYEQGQRMKAMEEMGDPAAYREKVRAELLAELQQSQPVQAAASAPPIPQSLASARSSATRTASTFTGPAPIQSLFEN